MEQHSISELLKSYRVEVFGIAVAFVVIAVIRFFYIGGSEKKKNPNTTTNDSKKEMSTTTSSNNNTTSETVEVNVNLSQLKEAEPQQVDVAESSILVVKDKNQVFAFGSKCTHAGAPLKNGFYMNGRIRCPWHGACFNTKSGDIEDYPCMDAIYGFETQVQGDNVTVKVPTKALKNNKRSVALTHKSKSSDPRTFVIIGAGAAGQTAAETLRQRGFAGRIVMIGREKHLPYDRTKLSKAMESTADKILLRPKEFFEEANIDLRTGVSAKSVNVNEHKVDLSDNTSIKFDKLLICTGGDPRTLPVPGADLKNIFPLRVPEDSQNIIKNVDGKRVVIVGTSFIGMEAASCIAKKAKSVIAIGMEDVPFERVLGKQIGSQLQKLFESNGISFRLKKVVKEFKGDGSGNVNGVVLDDGEHLEAELCILGAGIIPSTGFLSATDFTIERDRSIVADEYLQAKPDIYVAGDIARFPYWLTNHKVRVEHYAYSQYQGKIAATNMLGGNEPVHSVPFFWTTIFGKRITYAGHALEFNDFIVDGSISDMKFVAYYVFNGKVVAVVSVGRDQTAAKAAEYFHAGKMPTGDELKKGAFL